VITQRDMDRLGNDMAVLRDHLTAGTLTEPLAWRVLNRAEEMLRRAEGPSFQKDLRIIHSMLTTVWVNVRAADDLTDRLAG
jgi:hypothetical protein